MRVTGRSMRGAAGLVMCALAACRVGDARTPVAHGAAPGTVASSFASGEAEASEAAPSIVPGPFAPNRMGHVPVFEYHVIGAGRTEFHHTPEALLADLELLYRRGYRPVTVTELNERRIDQVVPAGFKAFAAVFDDASPSQFRYREGPNGQLVIDPTSGATRPRSAC
jgi:hypothetical protein